MNNDNILSYARFRFTMEASENATLPPYLGSTLRGAMGHALRQLVCKLPGGNCQKCMYRWQCAFVYVLATSRQETDNEGNTRSQALHHPYVIEPPETMITNYTKGDKLIFHILLIGNGISLLPLFIAAFIRVGKNGLGRNRHRFTLRRVEQEYDSKIMLLWRGGDNLLQPPLPIKLRIEKQPEGVKGISLIMHTPLRLVDKGRLDDSLDFSILMRAVFRRLDSLGRIHGLSGVKIDFHHYIKRANLVQQVDKDYTWLDWERYSSRQSSYMKLGGIVGKISYQGDLDEFIPYLKMTEILHAGKNSSFGLGRYNLVIDKKSTNKLGEHSKVSER